MRIKVKKEWGRSLVRMNVDNLPKIESPEVKAIWLMSLGGLDSCPVDPRVVFRAALLHGCAGILIAHNHPSGLIVPSNEDIALTQRLHEGAKLLSIKMVDHIIIGNETTEVFSFCGAGFLA